MWANINVMSYVQVHMGAYLGDYSNSKNLGLNKDMEVTNMLLDGTIASDSR